ncbi:iron chaperone [Diaminobutyricibacter sp. McL0618]|uniref:iron chaperone n=1 Tax=Leifsonia sp. McL0618 TaxID=3415677 RepID=UPI003CE6C25A
MVQHFETVDDYIASFPPDVQEVLQRVRQAIHAGVPDAPEKIRYDIAAVMIDATHAIHFAGWKNHVGVYPVPRLEGELEEEIAPYRAAKDSANFLYARPIPYDLIERVAAASVKRYAR